MDFTEIYEDTISSVSKAAKLGEVKTLKRLIKAKKSVDVADNRGWTPLHEAAYAGKSECLKVLILHEDTEVDRRCYEGQTALYFAAMQGHSQCVTELLHGDADPNLPDNELGTPLLMAVRGNHLDCVKLLLESNANIKCQYVNGWSVLHEAVHQDLPDMLSFLLEHGADFNLEEDYEMTPVFTAAKYGRPECLRRLLEAGANPNKPAEDGGTAVFIASQENHIESLQLLIDYKASVNKRTEDNYLPVHVAAAKGNYRCLEILMLHANKMKLNDSYESPINMAIYRGCNDCAKFLIQNGLEISKPYYTCTLSNVSEFTSLQCAVACNNVDMIQFLLENGAEINQPGQCVICVACDQEIELSILQLLLSHGARPCCIQYDSIPVRNDCIIPRSLIGYQIDDKTKLLISSGLGFESKIFQKCSRDKRTECLISMMRISTFDYKTKDVFNLMAFALNYIGNVSLCTHVYQAAAKEESMWNTVRSCASCPRSLQQLCRIKVRHMLGPEKLIRAEEFISQLPLPSLLQNYLLMK